MICSLLHQESLEELVSQSEHMYYLLLNFSFAHFFIAARVNGLGQFLEALKIGIVVRRHWPNDKTVFVQLFSDDGGDTIQ